MSVASISVVDYLRDQLAGRYRVERELGEGGMALVFLAHDLKHDRRVAIKVMRPEVSLLLGADRFLREIRIAAQLNHPGIVGLYDSGDAGGLLYYVMPYEEGQTLRERLEAGALPLDDALRIGQELADALAYAHEQQVVHRDIKPENILLLSHGHPAIADFGVARALAGAETARTSSSGRIGSPAYMSPEQFSGTSEVGPRSDIYALGCVVYEMLTGTAPYAGRDLDALRNRHCTAEVPSVRSHRREVPLAVDLAVRRALAKRPEERFQGVAEFGAALRMPQVTASGIMHAALRWLRFRAVPVAAAALVALIALLLFLQPPPPASATRLRIVVPQLTPGVTSLAPTAVQLAEELSDELARTPDLAVVPNAEARRYRDFTPQRLRGVLGVDQAVVLALSRDSVTHVSLRLVDARSSRLLGQTADVVAAGVVDAALVRRLGGFVRRALASYLDSLERRARFRGEDAWRLAEEARAQRTIAGRALVARAYRQAGQALARSDSLSRAAAAAEPTGAAGRLALVENRHGQAFLMEYLQQQKPDTATLVPDPVALRLGSLPLLDALLARDPDERVALQLRGTVEAGLARSGVDTFLAVAIRDLERATELGAGALAWAELAWAYGTKGDFLEELFAYERAMRADPFQYRRDTYLRGTFDAALRAGQNARAATACADGQREYPGDERFRDCELKLLVYTGSSADHAQRALTLADSLAPLDPSATSLAVARLYAGQVLARAGRRADAERQVRVAEASFGSAPLPSVVLKELAAVRLLLGDRDSALSLVRRATAAGPSLRGHLLNDPRFRALRIAPGG